MNKAQNKYTPTQRVCVESVIPDMLLKWFQHLLELLEHLQLHNAVALATFDGPMHV